MLEAIFQALNNGAQLVVNVQYGQLTLDGVQVLWDRDGNGVQYVLPEKWATVGRTRRGGGEFNRVVELQGLHSSCSFEPLEGAQSTPSKTLDMLRSALAGGARLIVVEDAHLLLDGVQVVVGGTPRFQKYLKVGNLVDAGSGFPELKAVKFIEFAEDVEVTV